MSDTNVETADDSLSPAEEAFFESRGEKAEGLAEQTTEPGKEPAQEGAEKAADASPEPDKKAEGDDPDAEETVEVENKGRFVRHGAFHKERMQRKALEQQVAERDRKLAEREQAFARVDERLKLLNEAIGPRQTEEEPPNLEDDIFGYVKWQAKQIEQLKGQTGKVAETTQAAQEEQRLRETYMADARSFAGKQADFGEAYQYLLQGRDAELQAFGIFDPQERAAMITEEERGLVQRAVKDGVSPSERVYNLAKARGYAKKEAAAPAEKTADQLDAIARGQAASKTLSSAGGSPTDVLSAEALANMPEEEFAAYLDKLPRAQQRALMGG